MSVNSAKLSSESPNYIKLLFFSHENLTNICFLLNNISGTDKLTKQFQNYTHKKRTWLIHLWKRA